MTRKYKIRLEVEQKMDLRDDKGRFIRGHPVPEEMRKKLSEARKRQVPPMLGKHQTEKARRKIAEAQTARKGENHPSWKGGRCKTGAGYVLIWSPLHPYANYRGYVRENRLVMEAHLGRYLKPEEVVHHENGIHDDNRIENLRLFSSENQHQKYHWAQRHLAG